MFGQGKGVTTGAGRASLGILGQQRCYTWDSTHKLMLGGDSPKNRRGTVGYNQKRQGKAKQSIGKYNTKDSDGTVRNRLKVGPKKVGSAEQSFDRAFAAARKANLSTFEWQGNIYTTEMV